MSGVPLRARTSSPEAPLTVRLTLILLAVLAAVLTARPPEPAPGRFVDEAGARGAREPTATGSARHPVRLDSVRVGELVRRIRGEGRVAPLRRATLRAGLGGRVLDVPVREGAGVAAGDLLVRLDSTLASLRRDAAEADLRRAALEFRSLTFDDSLLDLDPGRLRARRRHARARSGLDRAGTDLAVARVGLARTAVRAPFAGKVAGLAVAPGTHVRAGDSLLAVVDVSRAVVEATVLEEDAARIRPGARARVTLVAGVEGHLPGVVTAVSPVAERPAGRVGVRVLLEGSHEEIRPGTFAEVAIAVREFPDRTLVPIEAIVRRDARDVIFRFRPDRAGARTGTAEWVGIEVLAEGDGRAAIRARRPDRALEAGDPVLVDGHVLLAHGAAVVRRSTPAADRPR